MDDVRQEFWGDLQADLYVENSALFLANRSLEDVLSTAGYKTHKPILSHANNGTYTPGSDISYTAKTASKQTLTVSTFKYAAEEIDDTVNLQTPYDIPAHSLKSIRKNLLNATEQTFMDQLTNADQSIAGGTAQVVTTANTVDIFEEADGRLGAFDVPMNTDMRAAVLGPRTVAKLKNLKGARETGFGDRVLENGIVGPLLGYTIVQSNNLPYSAVLNLATQPTEADTVTIAGVTFEFNATPGDAVAGNVGVDLGANVDATRANLAAAINDSGTAGTTYVQLDKVQNFIIRNKRNITATNDNSADTLTIAGYGDIAVSSDLTDATDGWSTQRQTSIFMMRGAIDLVLQWMKLDLDRKEKGFADLVKGMIGVGANTFDDGARVMVKMTQDVSAW